jgi:hypothetical protein
MTMDREEVPAGVTERTIASSALPAFQLLYIAVQAHEEDVDAG